MIIPSALAQKHDHVRPYLAVVEGAVKDLLRGYADENGFAFVGRLKETNSVAEKIETGRYPSWSSLDDLYACCLVVPTLAHEPAAVEHLRQRFECIEVKSRGSLLKDPAVFRFDATRFIGRIPERMMPQASRDVLDVRFEVQVRTAFEHAWSSTTHALAYKGGRVDWRRLRLAAQLKAAVEQLDALISGYDVLVEEMAAQQWPEVEAKRNVETFFRERIESGRLSRDFEPSSWMRFCDNFLAIILAARAGYVDDKVDVADQALAVIELELVDTASAGAPRSLSLLQLCMGILAKHGSIKRPLRRYVPLITQELTDLYPEVRVLGPGFAV
jgi:ppGpp synthetase/RelA/SpoT-type nucleotidyltranferase